MADACRGEEGGSTGQLYRCGTAPRRREKADRGGVFGDASRPAGLKMAAAGRRAAERGVMAGARVCLTLLVAALMFAGAVLAREDRPRLLGAPVDIDNTDNDEGLQRALQFAVTEYNKASNDMYSSRVVRVISAKRQIVSGIKYIMTVEIGRTTCPKPATDLQSCAFHDAPQMAKHTTCDFVVYTIPWQNVIKLLTSNCK
ncbi:cystatin-like [Harpia harpyja]|uniref:cystatin-like n=1 Tax=Harpia harpyja TaxID=202280 RepID=UPI0022B177EB|nr:cystatin-like [Harpia harpyja]